MQFEVQIIQNLQSVASEGLTEFFQVVSLLGSYLGFVILLVVMLFFSRKISIAFSACFLGGVAFNYILKHLINRPRPFETHPEIMHLTDTVGQSMPSSHALCSVIIAIFLIYFVFVFCNNVWGRVGAIVGSLSLVALTFVSRMYLGMHYLTDLLVGALIGLVISAVAIFMLERKEKNVFSRRKF